MPPIILLCSRDLTKSELIQINKYFSTLQYNKYYHADKVASTAPFECIIVNLSSSASRDWWSVQCKNFTATDDVIWVRNSGDEQNADNLDGFQYKYSTKRIRLDCPDKATFINSLRQTHIATVISQKKKFLKKLLGCLCSSLSK